MGYFECLKIGGVFDIASLRIHKSDIISRSWDGKVDKVGDVRISYDWEGKVDKIGNVRISRYWDGKIDKIGNMRLEFDWEGNFTGSSGNIGCSW